MPDIGKKNQQWDLPFFNLDRGGLNLGEITFFHVEKGGLFFTYHSGGSSNFYSYAPAI